MTIQERLRGQAYTTSRPDQLNAEAADRIDADEALMRECLDALEYSDIVVIVHDEGQFNVDRLRKRLGQA
jgi:hypothetical protein